MFFWNYFFSLDCQFGSFNLKNEAWWDIFFIFFILIFRNVLILGHPKFSAHEMFCKQNRNYHISLILNPRRKKLDYTTPQYFKIEIFSVFRFPRVNMCWMFIFSCDEMNSSRSASVENVVLYMLFSWNKSSFSNKNIYMMLKKKVNWF